VTAWADAAGEAGGAAGEAEHVKGFACGCGHGCGRGCSCGGDGARGKPEPLHRQQPAGEGDAPPTLVEARRRRHSLNQLATVPAVSLAAFELSKCCPKSAMCPYESQEPNSSSLHLLTQKATLGCIRAPFSISLLSSTAARAAWPGAQEHPPSLGGLSPVEVPLCAGNCGASLLLLLVTFSSIFTPTPRLLVFLTAPITFTASIKGTEKFCHCIRAGNSFKSREKSPFIDTNNREEGSRPTTL